MPPPTIPSWSPTGAAETPDVTVEFKCDDDVQVDQTTLDLSLQAPGTTGYVYALQNGVWQAPNSGTIQSWNNGYDVKLTTHTPFLVGTWAARAYCEDNVATSVQKDWTFTVDTADPTITARYPEPGDVVTTFDGVRFRITDVWGFDTSTFVVRLRNSRNEATIIYDGGAGGWQTGFGGIYVPIGGADPTEIHWHLNELSEFESPMLWTIEVDATTIVGTTL